MSLENILIDSISEQAANTASNGNFIVATVKTFDPSTKTTQVIFPGSAAATNKYYPTIYEGYYNPREGDKALMAKVNGTFVVLGVIR